MEIHIVDFYVFRVKETLKKDTVKFRQMSGHLMCGDDYCLRDFMVYPYMQC